MSIKIDKLEKNKVRLTVDVSKEKLEEGLNYSYNKNKASLPVPGFRKGKVPRFVIEQTYGENIFFEDALNHVMEDVYINALIETDLDVIDKPEEVNVTEIDPNKGAVLVFSVLVEPEVTLGQYKDFEIPKIICEVTDDEIDTELNAVREQNVRLVSISDRAIKEGDIVTIKFQGFIDGEPFEGGETDGHDVEIGSHSLIDTFENQLIGHMLGDDIDVLVTFPDDYHVPQLCGKPAEFKTEILDIKEKVFPNIDDELAQDVSEFDTLDEFKQHIKDELLNKKQTKAVSDREDNILKTIVENSQVDVPNVMVDDELTSIFNNFNKNFESQNMSLSYFLNMTGQNYDQFRESFRPIALKNVSARLILAQVAKEENIAVEEEEFKAYLKTLADFKGNFDEIYKRLHYSEVRFFKKDFLLTKAFDFIKSTLTEV